MSVINPGIKHEDLVHHAREMIIKFQNPSVGFLQRHFRIGYNHAVALMKNFEGDIVTEPDANGWRKMLDSGKRSPDDPLFSGVVKDAVEHIPGVEKISGSNPSP